MNGTNIQSSQKDYSVSSFVCSLISIFIIPVGWIAWGLLLIISIGLAITGIVLAKKTVSTRPHAALAKAGMILSIVSLSLMALSVIIVGMFGN